jgi:hypothetical protein
MMSIFSKKPKSLQFSTRAEAFNYMLSFLVEEKNIQPLDAAKQANEFAEIFATNMGLPLVIEPKKEGIDKYLSMADKIGKYIQENPKVIEYGVPAITFIFGLLTGKKVDQFETKQDEEGTANVGPIDFEKIPD